jgi:cytidylate kinase
MAVITISRQLGSLGTAVAQQAANRLGYRIVEREVINQAALRAGAPEVALAMIDELHLLGVCPSEEACQAYIQALQCVIEELAVGGNIVIVGRAGQVILANRTDTLHVRLIAPLQIRIERIAQRRGISLHAARAQVTASDHCREKFLKRFYNRNLDDPDQYDLIINTARFTCEATANIICQTLLNGFRSLTRQPNT